MKPRKGKIQGSNKVNNGTMEQVKNNSIIFSNTQQNLKLPFKMSTLGSDSLANWDLTPYLPPPPS